MYLVAAHHFSWNCVVVLQVLDEALYGLILIEYLSMAQAGHIES